MALLTHRFAVLILVLAPWQDDAEKLPPLNQKVLQFVKDNIGKSVGDGECGTLMASAFSYAGARLPTTEETLMRVWSRRLGPKEKPLPGDVVEFKALKLVAKDRPSMESLFHTTILYKVKDGKFILLHQGAGLPVSELDLTPYDVEKGELIVYRPVPLGTKLPKVVLPSAQGTWAEKGQSKKVRYLSNLPEFDVKVAQNRFGKKGILGYGAGDSYQIRVNGKESPNGLSLYPDSNNHASVKYRLGKAATTFMAHAALNDSAGAPFKRPGEGKIPTALTFSVLGDGKVLWKSEPIDTAKDVQECKVDIVGVSVLELRVECPDSNVNTQAVWLEPRVLLK